MNDLAIVNTVTGEYIAAGDVTLDSIAHEFNQLEASTQEANWLKGYLLSQGSVLCEDPDCGIDGDNRDHRYGNWVSLNFGDTPQQTMYNYRNQWEKLGDRKDDPVVSRIPQSARYMLSSDKLDDKREEIIKSLPTDGKITIKLVEDEIKKLAHVHVGENSGNNEWYTPQEFIDAAVETMGGIDLDPASSEIANQRVGADTFYTEQDDGLNSLWFGRVWMNPPYAQPLIQHFSDKMCSSVENAEIEQAVVLVNNATETTWFQNMARIASAICFINKRIKFIDTDGNPGGAPLQGQAILYFGDNIDLFSEAHSKFGFMVRHV